MCVLGMLQIYMDTEHKVVVKALFQFGVSEMINVLEYYKVLNIYPVLLTNIIIPC